MKSLVYVYTFTSFSVLVVTSVRFMKAISFGNCVLFAFFLGLRVDSPEVPPVQSPAPKMPRAAAPDPGNGAEDGESEEEPDSRAIPAATETSSQQQQEGLMLSMYNRSRQTQSICCCWYHSLWRRPSVICPWASLESNLHALNWDYFSTCEFRETTSKPSMFISTCHSLMFQNQNFQPSKHPGKRQDSGFELSRVTVT